MEMVERVLCVMKNVIVVPLTLPEYTRYPASRSAIPLLGALAILLCVLNRFNDFAECCVTTEVFNPNLQSRSRTRSIVPAYTRTPMAFSTGYPFAGYGRLVNKGTSADNFAINWDACTRSNEDLITYG